MLNLKYLIRDSGTHIREEFEIGTGLENGVRVTKEVRDCVHRRSRARKHFQLRACIKRALLVVPANGRREKRRPVTAPATTRRGVRANYRSPVFVLSSRLCPCLRLCSANGAMTIVLCVLYTHGIRAAGSTMLREEQERRFL